MGKLCLLIFVLVLASLVDARPYHDHDKTRLNALIRRLMTSIQQKRQQEGSTGTTGTNPAGTGSDTGTNEYRPDPDVESFVQTEFTDDLAATKINNVDVNEASTALTTLVDKYLEQKGTPNGAECVHLMLVTDLTQHLLNTSINNSRLAVGAIIMDTLSPEPDLDNLLLPQTRELVQYLGLPWMDMVQNMTQAIEREIGINFDSTLQWIQFEAKSGPMTVTDVALGLLTVVKNLDQSLSSAVLTDEEMCTDTVPKAVLLAMQALDSNIEQLIDNQLYNIYTQITDTDPVLEPFAYLIALHMTFYTEVFYVAVDLLYSVYFEVQARVLYKDLAIFNVTSGMIPPVAGYLLENELKNLQTIKEAAKTVTRLDSTILSKNLADVDKMTLEKILAQILQPKPGAPDCEILHTLAMITGFIQMPVFSLTSPIRNRQLETFQNDVIDVMLMTFPQFSQPELLASARDTLIKLVGYSYDFSYKEVMVYPMYNLLAFSGMMHLPLKLRAHLKLTRRHTPTLRQFLKPIVQEILEIRRSFVPPDSCVDSGITTDYLAIMKQFETRLQVIDAGTLDISVDYFLNNTCISANTNCPFTKLSIEERQKAKQEIGAAIQSSFGEVNRIALDNIVQVKASLEEDKTGLLGRVYVIEKMAELIKGMRRLGGNGDITTDPSGTPGPSGTPDLSGTPGPSGTPAPSGTPGASETPDPTGTPGPTTGPP